MIKAHQIKLYPTRSQEIFFRKSCGVARYSYNWALAKWKELYEAGEKTTAYSLIKLQNSIKREQMPFFGEVGKCAPQYAIHHLEKAFKLFFNKTCKYPRFKKKGKKDSFVAIENNIQFKQNDLKIHIPRLGKIKCSENLRFKGKVNHVIITRRANMWFAVINVEIPDSIPALKPKTGDNQAIVGVDLGIKSMMVLSDGTIFENPRALKSNLKRLKQRQRNLSKKQKGSKNKRKQQMKVARLYYRISCIRSNAIHQATTFIVKKYDKIVMENLNAAGMAKNRKLSQALSDVSFGEIGRQLAYKCAWSGKELVKADRWFASSKICSSCGHKKDKLKLSERTYNCEKCGLSIDRDLNAAKNLASYSPTEKFSESHAFGVGSSSVAIPDSLTVNKELKINYLTN
jgi:putative transposase